MGAIVSSSHELNPPPIVIMTVNVEIHTEEHMDNRDTQLLSVEEKLMRNLRRQTLLADIAQSLHSLHNLPQKLSNILRLLGEHTQVSRVYIFEDSKDGLSTSNTYEWCNEKISAQIAELQQVPYEYIASWPVMLDRDGRIFSTNIKELPADVYEVLAPQQIQSILVYPLIVEEKRYGFIGFDECTRIKHWELDELELLRSISGIISGAFERQLFQLKLSQSEAQLKMAINNTNTGLWDVNLSEGSLYLNDVLLQMLGYTHEAQCHTIAFWQTKIHAEDLLVAVDTFRAHVSGQTPLWEVEMRLLNAQGQWVWLLAKGSVVEWQNSETPLRAIGTVINIDEQKQLEDALRKANITKDRFFSIIGHDLRGPIGNMMQVANMMSQKQPHADEMFYTFIELQKELSQHTFHLLENLLSWARYNSDKLECKPQHICLNELIAKNVKAMKFQAFKKSISINFEKSALHYVYADEDMVTLVIRNILSNALKFTALEGEINIRLSYDHGHSFITVEDNGIGIPANKISSILSEEEIYTTVGTQNEKGSGLGLKLCKTFVDMNGGQFLIESEAGHGSRFIIGLPAHPPKA